MKGPVKASMDPLFFSSRRRHTRYWRDWSSDVCSSDLDHVGEPVGAEEDTVACVDGQDGRVHIYLLLRTQSAGDEVLLGVLRGLVSGQVPAAHQLGNERVVLGQGPQVPAAQEVRPRVPYVCDLRYRPLLSASEPGGNEGSSHPRELLVAPADGEYLTVGLLDRGLEGGAGLEVPEHPHRDGARHLSGLEATDAVGDREQCLVFTLPDEEGIFVVPAHLARVGDAERFQEQQGYSSYLKIVDPIRTVSPSLKGVAPTVLRSFTKVP